MKAVVFGELALDILIKLPAGNSQAAIIRGDSYKLTTGGHGANQSIALSRLGVDTSLIARIGNDVLSVQALRALQDAGVSTEGIFSDIANLALAVLAIDCRGEFQVLAFVEGVNTRIDNNDVRRFISHLSGVNVALFQLGYPTHMVASAVREAKRAEIPTILDPTPVKGELPPDLYPLSDYITPNEVEAEQLVGIRVCDHYSASAAAHALQQRGAKNVIIKLGDKGAFYQGAGESVYVPAFHVSVIDTVGAGDAFNACFAACLVRGYSIREAMIWATAAGALTVMGEGAQTTMPDERTIRAFLDEH